MDLGQLARWNRRWLADGLVLVPPGGGGDGSLVIRTQQRPLRPFHQLLGDASVGPLERFTTIEGEHAGIVAVDEPAGPRFVAMIVGDDSYVLVDARTSDRARAPWYRELVHTIARFYPLGLGKPRKRRYMYRPPAGWQAIARPGCALWLEPDYPQTSGKITVFDARPLAWFAPGAVDRFLFIDENPFLEQDAGRSQIALTARPGLTGPSTRATGRGRDGTPITLIKTLLQDGRYFYAVELEARSAEWEALMPTYGSVLSSIEPVPESSIARSAQQFMHWID